MTRVLVFQLLLFLAWAEDAPPCRKSPLLVALTKPGADAQELVAYGGKGWEWARKGKGGKGKLKKRVEMFSDVWRYEVDQGEWFRFETSGPLGRWKEAATPVQNSSKLVLMGGCTETSVQFSRNDLWVFNPADGTWVEVETRNKPVPRRGHVIVANQSHLIMFGGKSTKHYAKRSYAELPEDENPQQGEKCLVDLWAISKEEVLAGSEPRWTQGPPFPAPCRWGSTGVVISGKGGAKKRYLAFFGGRHLGEGSVEHTDQSAYIYYNDLWLYDFIQEKWSLAPTEGPRPPARDHHGSATLQGKLFIYGGRRSEKREEHSVLADVWSYDLDTSRWTFYEPQNAAPMARFMPGVSDWKYKGVPHLAIFAGESLPGSTKRTTMNDLWVFNPHSGIWTELFTSNCDLPEETPAVMYTTEALCLVAGFGFVSLLVLGLKKLRPSVAREMQEPLL
ncbi:unnamed protein product [Effrenium voratum]|nr:unnamed protein product [Effrenium voratum]